jgi:hypothetical protein
VSRVGSGGNVGLQAAVSTNPSGQTVVTLTFDNSNPAVIDQTSLANGGAASLADGRYRLAISSAAVSGLGGALDGDANGTAGGDFQSPDDTSGGGAGQVGLYRLFGDATGNGVVDLVDLQEFRGTFNVSSPNPGYLAYLDADNNGTVDLIDLQDFRGRFNENVFVP